MGDVASVQATTMILSMILRWDKGVGMGINRGIMTLF